MQTRTLILTMLTVAACGGGSKHATTPAAGGAVTIETLERTVPAGEDLGDAKVRVPYVTVVGDPAASAAINTALDIPNTAAKLDAITELGEVGLDYEVAYNQRGLLDLSIVHETMGAYPDSYVQHHLFDVTTGAQLRGADVLVADAMPALAAALDAQVQGALAQARTDNPDCVTEDDDPYAGAFKFTVDNLADIGVVDGGVTFTYDYDFPHVMQACEPTGSFSMSMAEIAPYLRPDGALARLTN